MTETAKEHIENEIKSVEKRLHRGRNDGKTYNIGVKEGLMIARAHVIDSVSTDKLSVEKLQERCDRYEKALTEIASPNMIGAARIPLYRKIASEALAEIGGDDDRE